MKVKNDLDNFIKSGQKILTGNETKKDDNSNSSDSHSETS